MYYEAVSPLKFFSQTSIELRIRHLHMDAVFVDVCGSSLIVENTYLNAGIQEAW